MADLTAVQCPRCGHRTVAGHRDCLVCGRTIHPEIDPRARIHYCMEIRDREVLFHSDYAPQIGMFLMPLPIIGIVLFLYLRDFDFPTLTLWGWAAVALGILAIAILAARALSAWKSRPPSRPFLKLDSEGIHIPRFKDFLVPWDAIEKTEWRGEELIKFGRGYAPVPTVELHLNRDIEFENSWDPRLRYDDHSRKLTLGFLTIDPLFIARAVDFFRPILTQER